MGDASESRPGWSATPRGRRELAVLGLFALAHLVIPPLALELFPFTVLPVFCDTPQRYCKYRVWGPDGEEIPEDELPGFGLHHQYWGIPPEFPSGREPAPTIHAFGEVPDEVWVRDEIARRLASRGGPEWVTVERTVVGPREDGSVGVVSRSERWTIRRPEPR